MYDQRVTIAEAVENIQREDYLLPAIQREIVWERSQITDLFDSVLPEMIGFDVMASAMATICAFYRVLLR